MKPDIALLGPYLDGDAYPHARTTLAQLRACGRVALDATRPVLPRQPLWKRRSAVAKRLATANLLLGLAAGALHGLIRWLRGPRPPVAYVPYPALPMLLLLGLLPRRLRPGRIVADAFVSWYDSAAGDRGLLAERGIPARLLRAVERSAFRQADRVVCDTVENAAWLAELLDLPRKLFASAPLAVPDAADVHLHLPPASPAGRLRVLFCGTFVPLQGTGTLAAAALRLADDDRFELVAIGDGQDADAFATLLASRPTALRWLREMLPLEVLRAWVRSADVCIGILGDRPKSARVWPLKNYLYAQEGRTIVTSRRHGWPAGVARPEADSAVLIPPDDADALVAALTMLADDPARCERGGAAARRLFELSLSPSRALACLLEVIDAT